MAVLHNEKKKSVDRRQRKTRREKPRRADLNAGNFRRDFSNGRRFAVLGRSSTRHENWNKSIRSSSRWFASFRGKFSRRKKKRKISICFNEKKRENSSIKNCFARWRNFRERSTKSSMPEEEKNVAETFSSGEKIEPIGRLEPEEDRKNGRFHGFVRLSFSCKVRIRAARFCWIHWKRKEIFRSERKISFGELDSNLRVLTMKNSVVDVRVHRLDFGVTSFFVLAEQLRFERINGKVQFAVGLEEKNQVFSSFDGRNSRFTKASRWFRLASRFASCLLLFSVSCSCFSTTFLRTTKTNVSRRSFDGSIALDHVAIRRLTFQEIHQRVFFVKKLFDHAGETFSKESFAFREKLVEKERKTCRENVPNVEEHRRVSLRWNSIRWTNDRVDCGFDGKWMSDRPNAAKRKKTKRFAENCEERRSNCSDLQEGLNRIVQFVGVFERVEETSCRQKTKKSFCQWIQRQTSRLTGLLFFRVAFDWVWTTESKIHSERRTKAFGLFDLSFCPTLLRTWLVSTMFFHPSFCSRNVCTALSFDKLGLAQRSNRNFWKRNVHFRIERSNNFRCVSLEGELGVVRRLQRSSDLGEISTRCERSARWWNETNSFLVLKAFPISTSSFKPFFRATLERRPKNTWRPDNFSTSRNRNNDERHKSNRFLSYCRCSPWSLRKDRCASSRMKLLAFLYFDSMR